MTGISAISAAATTTPTMTPTVTGVDGASFSAGIDRTAMDTNTFLKLLVAQLQYQDPSNPTDSSQFMAQTAQFTAVEKMQQLTDLQEQVLDSSRGQTATALVGRTVTYTDVSGTARTGLATACTIGSGMPRLTVDGIEVELGSVTSVSSTPATTTTGSG
jgi:flagellar basal-body rod modification protein FlgD